MANEARAFRRKFPSDVVSSRYARARLARAEAVAALPAAAFNSLRALAGRVAEWRRDARTRRELAALSDRELADIGLARSDLRRRDFSGLARHRAEPHPSARAAAAEPANGNDARSQAA
jgi:uncharacterized protein YjiS (DUF1127 family)